MKNLMIDTNCHFHSLCFCFSYPYTHQKLRLTDTRSSKMSLSRMLTPSTLWWRNEKAKVARYRLITEKFYVEIAFNWTHSGHFRTFLSNSNLIFLLRLTMWWAIFHIKFNIKVVHCVRYDGSKFLYQKCVGLLSLISLIILWEHG